MLFVVFCGYKSAVVQPAISIDTDWIKPRKYYFMYPHSVTQLQIELNVSDILR
jgi:hypothetical protein